MVVKFYGNSVNEVAARFNAYVPDDSMDGLVLGEGIDKPWMGTIRPVSGPESVHGAYVACGYYTWVQVGARGAQRGRKGLWGWLGLGARRAD